MRHYQRRSQGVLSGGVVKPKGLKFEAEGRERGWGSWGGGIEPPTHQLGGLGECCKLPQWGSGRSG